MTKNFNKIMKKRPFTIAWLLILSMFLFRGYAQTSIPDWENGAVIHAASGSPDDIRTALAGANPGDIIQLPAGTFIFNEQVALDAGVYIRGAGSDKTILQKTNDSTSPFFYVNGSNGLPFWISHIKIIGDQAANSTLMDEGIYLRYGCRDFRITEVEFEHLGVSAISVSGDSRGVIDNCRFINMYRSNGGSLGYGVSVMGGEYDEGDAAWARPFVLGDENAVFVEDCYFIGNRHAIASNNGSRYVFRHNLIEDNAGEVQAIDAHGQKYYWPRGSRSYEIYGNTIDNANTSCWSAIYIRGGDGVVFDNTIIQGINYAENVIALVNENPDLDQIRELHLWDNYYKGALIEQVANLSSASLVKDRDYFVNIQRPGYTPYTYPHPLRGSDSILGLIKDQTNFNTLSVFPNPAKEVLNFDIPDNQAQTISIYSSPGKLISEQKYTDNSVNISGLDTGMYFLVIKGMQKNYHAKFIIK